MIEDAENFLFYYKNSNRENRTGNQSEENTRFGKTWSRYDQ